MPYPRAPSYENVGDISFYHAKKLSIPLIIGHSSPDARNEERLARNARIWSTFMYDVTCFLHSGYSLSAALGADFEAYVADGEKLAGNLLSDNEKELYLAWVRDPQRALPLISDWKAIRERLTATTSAQIAHWDGNTHALMALYERTDISKESCKGWMEKYDWKVPLIVAMKKVLRTEREVEAAKRRGSSYMKYIHELMACRKIMSEIGKYRIESNAITKELHKYVQRKEEKLNRKLFKLERYNPTGARDAKDVFIDRETYWKRLTSLRVEKEERGGITSMQNMTMRSLERSLKDRITALENRLGSDRTNCGRDRNCSYYCRYCL